MFFGMPYTTSQINEPIIRAGNVTIEAVEEYKYLGVVLDKNLKFDKYVDYIKQVGYACYQK